MLEDLLDEKKDEHCDLWADSVYLVENQDNTIGKCKINNKVNEKGKRNNPLTEKQKASNREKSKIRARVEHVFGFIEVIMNRLRLNWKQKAYVYRDKKFFKLKLYDLHKKNYALIG